MTRKLNKPLIEIWTDGSVQPTNPGPHGGWSAILLDPKRGRIRAISGYFPNATNQRAEASAVLHALETLTRPCTVSLFTDSMYVISCIRKMLKKQKSNWLPESNREVWQQLRPYFRVHTIRLEYVKGHNDNEMNEWADVLAYKASHLYHGQDAYYRSVPVIEKRSKLKL